MTPRQLTFDFPHREALDAEDFLVAPPNADAVAWIDKWPDWPGPLLVICGPAGCGKTHLSRVFMSATDAISITADALRDTDPMDVMGGHGACVIEDADAWVGRQDEEALFHLFNAVRSAGRHMLMTAKTPPARWPLSLADLRSRLNTGVCAEIKAPDDALIGAVLIKMFADRQLKVDADVVRYLLVRMDRSFAAARTLVDALDAAALAEKRAITTPLVRRVLGA